MNPDHVHFPVLLPSSSIPKGGGRGRRGGGEGEGEGGKTKLCGITVCSLCAHWSMVKLPVASPLKKTESLLTCTTPEPSIPEIATLQHPLHNC